MRLRQKCGFDVHYVPGEENERKYGSVAKKVLLQKIWLFYKTSEKHR